MLVIITCCAVSTAHTPSVCVCVGGGSVGVTPGAAETRHTAQIHPSFSWCQTHKSRHRAAGADRRKSAVTTGIFLCSQTASAWCEGTAVGRVHVVLSDGDKPQRLRASA